MAGIASGIVDWALAVLGPWGAPGLFLVAFTEAVVSPIPVEALLVPFAAELPGPWPWWWWGLVASTGSVLGSLAGYLVGDHGGHPLLVRLVGEGQARKLHRYYERWGAGAVFITGITPLPYKVFTIGSGVLELDLRKFTLAAIAGRGIRFMAIAYVSAVVGPEVLDFVDRNLLPIVAVSLLVLVAWALWAWRRVPEEE